MTHGGRLHDLLDPAHAAHLLAAVGLSDARAAEVRRHFLRCVESLRASGASASARAHAFVVPGRIEVLGKHTDYAGGRSILAAAERGFTVVATCRADGRLRVVDAATGEAVRLELDPDLRPARGWANYATTVARRVARNFPAARAGADIAFASDLPPAAGMSSSSALIVSLFLALAAVNDLAEDESYRGVIRTTEELAGYLAAVESGQGFRTLEGDLGVGTEGGSEDHTAMLCAQPGRLVQYGFAPVRFQRALPLPPGHCFVVAFSGVRAEKTGEARERYNRAAGLMRAAAELWRVETGRADATIGAALDADPDAVQRLRAALAGAGSTFAIDALRARVDQFIAESREIIPAAGDALARGDLVSFGTLVDRSQELAERLLGNQVIETVHLARSAREAGAAAASAFGAGFGGSVWALVPDSTADEFLVEWRAAYSAVFPGRATDAMFFPTGAGPSAARVL